MHQLLGPEVSGTICTDRYGVYQKVPLKQRGLCWAHLQRDFKELSEQAASASLGAAGVELCRQVHRLWDQFAAGTIDRSMLQKRARELRGQMKKLLKEGRDSTAKRASTFCRELLRFEPALWTFTRVAGIEPTNNHAERMLRPGVMWRKQSLGSHSLDGCRFVERVMTALQTLRLTGRSIMDYFEQAIHALRHGLSPPKLIGE
jgi:transposase